MREPDPREVMFELLDCVSSEDWQRVRRLSRKIARMTSPRQREVYADLWIAAHGSNHPGVARWITDRKVEREREEAANQSFMSSSTFGMRFFR